MIQRNTRRAQALRVVSNVASSAADAVGHGLKLWQQIVIALIVITPCGIALYKALDREPPVTIESIRVVPDKVVAGHDIQVLISGKVSRYCSGVLTRTLVSTSGASQASDVERIVLTEDGGSATMIRSMPVPASFSPGEAVYRAEASFTCNPMQTFWPITVRAPDARFTVEAQAAADAPAAVRLPPQPVASVTRRLAAVRRPAAPPVVRTAPEPPANQSPNPLMALFGLK